VPREVTEHSPLSALDEYPIQQLPRPIRIVETTDARAYNRYWFSVLDRAGEVYMVTGFGVYPNLDTREAYAIVVNDGTHSTVTIRGLLGDNPANIRCGPWHAEVIEPFRQWRLTLDPNESPIGFDLHWRDTKRAVFQQLGAPGVASAEGRPRLSSAGYETFGSIEGTITCNGRTFDLEYGRTRGSRDHHWGARDGVGGRAFMEPTSRISHCGQWIEFDDWAIWGQRHLYNLGDDRLSAGRVAKMEYKLRFDPITHHLLGGVITNTLDSGDVKEIHYEQIGTQVAYLRCGGYPGITSGSPDDDLYHGMYVGDDEISFRIDDVTDPEVRVHLAGFDDHLCSARCGDETTVATLECRNPLVYEMCRDGVPGFTFLDD